MSCLDELKSGLRFVKYHKIPVDFMQRYSRGAKLCSFQNNTLRVRFEEKDCCIHQYGKCPKTLFAVQRDGLEDLDAYVIGKMELLIKEAEEMISYGYEQITFSTFTRHVQGNVYVKLQRFHDFAGFTDFDHFQKDVVEAYLFDKRINGCSPNVQYGKEMIPVMLEFEKEFVSNHDFQNMNPKLRDMMVTG